VVFALCISVCGPVPTIVEVTPGLPRNTLLVSECDIVPWDVLIDDLPFSLCRLDVEVERAFKKGFAEERQKHIDDMKALNAAIEVKETRITELLVAMAAMEKKVGYLCCIDCGVCGWAICACSAVVGTRGVTVSLVELTMSFVPVFTIAIQCTLHGNSELVISNAAAAPFVSQVMASDTQVAEMTRATEAMKLEVADTIASLSQMALSGGGGGGAVGEDGE
jgi:hypothetical protein